MSVKRFIAAIAALSACMNEPSFGTATQHVEAEMCVGDDCEIKTQIAELKTAIQVNISEIAVQTESRHVAEEMANEADEARMAAEVQIASWKEEKRDLQWQIGINVATFALEAATAGYATGVAMGCKAAIKAGRLLSKWQRVKKITKAVVGTYAVTVSVKHGANDPPGDLTWTAVVPFVGEAAEIWSANNQIGSLNDLIAVEQAGIAALEDKRTEGLTKAAAAQARIETLEARNAELQKRINTLEALLAILAGGGCVGPDQIPVFDWADLELDPNFAPIDDAWRDAEDTDIPEVKPEDVQKCKDNNVVAWGSYRTDNYRFYDTDKTFAADSAHTACIQTFESPTWRLDGCSRGYFVFDIGGCSYEQSGSFFSDKLTIAKCPCRMRCCTGGVDLNCINVDAVIAP